MKVWTRGARRAYVAMFALGVAVGAAAAECIGWYRARLASQRYWEEQNKIDWEEMTHHVVAMRTAP